VHPVSKKYKDNSLEKYQNLPKLTEIIATVTLLNLSNYSGSSLSFPILLSKRTYPELKVQLETREVVSTQVTFLIMPALHLSELAL